jgi:hypothetical protein
VEEDDKPGAGDPVELVDAGREPRRLLRYAPEPGSQQLVRVEAYQEFERGSHFLDPVPKETGKMVLEIRAGIVERLDTGDLVVDLHIREVSGAGRLADGEQQPSRDHLTVTDRGLVSEAEARSSEWEDLSVVLAAGPLLALVPLPRQAVGAGALWRWERRIRYPPWEVTQEYTFRLLDCPEDGARVSAEIRLGELRRVPGSDTETLVSWSGAGSGEVALRRDRLLAVRARTAVEVHIRTELTRDGETRSAEHTLRAGCRIDEEKPPGR